MPDEPNPMAVPEWPEPEERPESERPPEDSAGLSLLGIPGMVGLLVVVAAWSISHSLLGVLLAVAGVVLLLLAIGLAMTIAKRS